MATKTIHTCDRCGREVAHKDQLRSIRSVSGVVSILGELCWSCSAQLRRFIAGQATPPPSEDKIVFHDGSELS